MKIKETTSVEKKNDNRTRNSLDRRGRENGKTMDFSQTQ